MNDFPPIQFVLYDNREPVNDSSVAYFLSVSVAYGPHLHLTDVKRVMMTGIASKTLEAGLLKLRHLLHLCYLPSSCESQREKRPIGCAWLARCLCDSCALPSFSSHRTRPEAGRYL